MTWTHWNASRADWEHLTALVQMPKVAATEKAFALWFSGADGMATWGSPGYGDSSEAQDQLRNVMQLRATRHGAFAAILANGSVVTWGDPERGGDCSAVQGQLRNVQKIQSTESAFAAIIVNGSVVAWGQPESCDCFTIQDQLRNVRQIQATDHAFAALLANGSVVTWGDPDDGGDCSAVQGQLKSVHQIQAADSAFAAILADGSVVASGDPDGGGDCLQVRDLLRNVKLIQCTAAGAFAVVLADGSVITWGNPNKGGDCSAVQDQLRNVQQIQATARSFAAILADRSVVSWGHGSFGGLAVTSARSAQERVVTVVGSGRTWFAFCDPCTKQLLPPLQGGATYKTYIRIQFPITLSHTYVYSSISPVNHIVVWGSPSCDIAIDGKQPSTGGLSSVFEGASVGVSRRVTTDSAIQDAQKHI